MSASPYGVQALDLAQDRDGFDCRSEPLNRYFLEQVGQDMRRRVAACFVARTPEGRVAGFYTLASGSVLLSDLPIATAKKLPRYPAVPVVRMGRLAVDHRDRGLGLGGALLADALQRATAAEIAAHALVVDAKDAQAQEFYTHHGFIPLPQAPLTLFLPLSVIQRL